MKVNDDSQKTNLRMKRIKNFSSISRAILLAALIVQGLALLLLLPVILHLKDMKSQPALNNLDSLVILPFTFMVTLNFFRLFTRLRDGHFFDSQTIRQLENAGKWWMAAGIIRTVLECLEVWILHPNNIMISGPNGIVAGLIVFFIAWLFGEAQKLQEEQELTV